MKVREKPTPQQVIAVALSNLKGEINLSNKDIAEIIGSSATSVNRYFKFHEMGACKKEEELSLLLIRVYRSLFSLNGGNKDAIIHWLNTHNYHINGVPIEKLKTVTGLVEAVTYLDAIRGKI